MEAIMIRTLATTQFSSHAFGATGSVISIPAIVNRLGAWAALARQRRQLASLDAERLSDIGLSADRAAHEAARPFWEASRTC